MRVLILLAIGIIIVGVAQAAPQRQRQPRQRQAQQQLEQQQEAQQFEPQVIAEAPQVQADPVDEGPVGDGIFNWTSVTANGSKHEQSGYIKNPEEPDPKKRIQVIQGSYVTFSNGKPVTTYYIADENGYRAVGEHIPTPKPASA